MTSDEFNAEYRLGQCLTSDGIRSTLAQEARKGRLVLVHELSTGSPSEQRRTEILLRQLAPGDAAQVIGSYEVDGAPVVVTKFLLGFTSLLAWLEAAVAQSQTRVIDTRDNPPTLDMAIHDPANYRRRPAEPIVAPGLEDTSVRPAIAPNRVAPPESAPRAVPPPDAPPAAATDTGSTDTGSTDTGSTDTGSTDTGSTESFTKLFGEPASAQGPAAPEPEVAEPATGGFTQLFGSGATPPAATTGPSIETPPSEPEAVSEDVSPPHTPPIVPASPPSTAGEPATGDFTRLFGASEPSRPPAAVPRPQPPQPPPLRAPQRPAPAAPPPALPLNVTPPATFSEGHESAPAAPPPSAGGPPPPPRVRLDALNAPPSWDPVSAPGGGPRTGATSPASPPPTPFPMSGGVADGRGLAAGTVPPISLSAAPPGVRAPIGAHPPLPASPPSGGYTEMLTPARPPVAQAPSRLPPPAAAAAPTPPRPQTLPLVVGLVIFVVLAAAVVVGFVLTAS